MNNRPVAVIGLGHVGLTLALTLAEEGLAVIGVEKSPPLLKSLQQIQPPFFEKGLEALLKKHLGGNFTVAGVLPAESPGAYILCVGTPLKGDNTTPDLKGAEGAIREIAAHLQGGELVILRSTVPVGTSRKVFLPILEAAQKEFFYACCPERTCEGVALRELRELPQIIGGINEKSARMAKDLFGKIAPQLVLTPSLETAEIVKLMDNCWRDTTFGFANEMALLCEALGLNALEVIGLANLGYERNTIPKPGFVGGPCLTKDPYLLAQPAFATLLTPLELTQTARDVNKRLPLHVLERLFQFFQKNGKDITRAKFFLSGLAFKGDPPTDDLRGSPGLDLLERLRLAGAQSICGHDFVISPQALAGCDIHVVSLEEGFQDADAVFFLNNHSSYKDLKIESYLRRMKKPAFFFDAWQLFSTPSVRKVAGIFHGGIGF